jgi:hypothetical protein
MEAPLKQFRLLSIPGVINAVHTLSLTFQNLTNLTHSDVIICRHIIQNVQCPT